MVTPFLHPKRLSKGSCHWSHDFSTHIKGFSYICWTASRCSLLYCNFFKLSKGCFLFVMGKPWPTIHSILFMRDTMKQGLDLSLIFSQIMTRVVPYLFLGFNTIFQFTYWNLKWVKQSLVNVNILHDHINTFGYVWFLVYLHNSATISHTHWPASSRAVPYFF